MPSFAQDTTLTEEDPSFAIVTGAVSFTPEGDIMVAGIVIAPAGAFNPSALVEGDLVIITGYMLNETTLQAASFEFFDDSPEVTPEATAEVTPEITPEATPESTPEATPEATPEVTPEATPEATPVLEICGNPNHPVATRIAETFEVSYEEVMALHCAGNGFGNIIRAYTLAEASENGETAQDFIDRHHGGEGWGQIMRDGDVHPSELAPGQVLKNKDDAETADTQSGNGNGNGNGGGNGNGNGGGNGNGHGNGNGNGNGGGNGNGNGNGGGKDNKGG